MKGVMLLGIVLLVLGVLSFVVPIPHSENHGVKIGDTKIGVQTESSEKLPAAVGVVLLAGGAVALVLGARKSLRDPASSLVCKRWMSIPTRLGFAGWKLVVENDVEK